MNKTIYTNFSAGQFDSAGGILKNVSVISEGPALGHDMHVDQTSLQTVLTAAQAAGGTVKSKLNHGGGLDSVIGTLSNFKIVGSRVLADLALLKSHPAFAHISELASKLAGQFGLSISFAMGTETIGEKTFMRVQKLFSVDLVSDPAANAGGLFSANGQHFMSTSPTRQELSAIIAKFEPKNKIPANWPAESVRLEAERICFQNYETHPWMRAESVLSHEYWRPDRETARIVGEYFALTDSMLKMAFYRKHKQTIDLAYHCYNTDERNERNH